MCNILLTPILKLFYKTFVNIFWNYFNFADKIMQLCHITSYYSTLVKEEQLLNLCELRNDPLLLIGISFQVKSLSIEVTWNQKTVKRLAS